MYKANKTEIQLINSNKRGNKKKKRIQIEKKNIIMIGRKKKREKKIKIFASKGNKISP